jgi:monooxygenase
VSPQHVDVLIVGAGLSGVGAACRLQAQHPQRTSVILEARDAIGGTWDLFRYPGVRSDSDMFTLGYPFRPWTDPKAIADGGSILRYIRETAAEFGVDRHIRYGRRVTTAVWSSRDARWSVEAGVGDGGEPERYTCDFLYLCSGYYSYEGGYTPELPGVGSFGGRLVHPQQWPEDLDHAGRRVVVIGSGATAVTLVPALAEHAEHVTMLQRSPTYMTVLPDTDVVADVLRGRLPEQLAHRVVRWKNVLIGAAFYQLCRRAPGVAKRLLRAGVGRYVPDPDVLDRDYTPRYEPWDQRLCIVPNADLFRAVAAGRASVVTDTIATFTEGGVRLTSGRELAADVVVTATGLRLVACGGIRLVVDGTEIDPGATFIHRASMLSGVPNLAMSVGYTNASWTLRSDLTARHVCALLAHMDRHGYASATPRLDEAPEPAPLLPLTSGYVVRAAAALPKQGARAPWVMRQNYLLDRLDARFGDLTRSLVFARRPAARGDATSPTSGTFVA